MIEAAHAAAIMEISMAEVTASPIARDEASSDEAGSDPERAWIWRPRPITGHKTVGAVIAIDPHIAGSGSDGPSHHDRRPIESGAANIHAHANSDGGESGSFLRSASEQVVSFSFSFPPNHAYTKAIAAPKLED